MSKHRKPNLWKIHNVLCFSYLPANLLTYVRTYVLTYLLAYMLTYLRRRSRRRRIGAREVGILCIRHDKKCAATPSPEPKGSAKPFDVDMRVLQDMGSELSRDAGSRS